MSRIDLHGIPETLLIPLFVRAKATLEKQPRITDQKAVDIVNSLDYDFSKWEGSKLTYKGVVARTIILDREVKAYIKDHPDAIIVNIGCGFDTRFDRVDNGQIDWYDLDVPEAIEARKKFFPPHERVHTIAKSAWDFTWCDDVQVNGRPVLFIAEGLLMYFTEQEVKELFVNIQDRFPGSLLLIELMAKWSASHTSMHDSVSKTGATFKWGVSSGDEVIRLCPGLEKLGYWSLSGEMGWLWGAITYLFNDTIGLYKCKSN